MERSTADTKERSPVKSPCRVVTSVTHDSQSRSPVESYTTIVLKTLTGLPGVTLVLVGEPILTPTSKPALRRVNLKVVGGTTNE